MRIHIEVPWDVVAAAERKLARQSPRIGTVFSKSTNQRIRDLREVLRAWAQAGLFIAAANDERDSP